MGEASVLFRSPPCWLALPGLDEESRSPLSAEQMCIEPQGLGPGLCPRPRDLQMNGVQSSPPHPSEAISSRGSRPLNRSALQNAQS